MIKKKSREIDNVRKSKDDFNVHKSFSPIVQRKIGLANGEEFLKSHLDYLLGKCTEVMGQWRVDCPRKSGFFFLSDCTYCAVSQYGDQDLNKRAIFAVWYSLVFTKGY